MSRGPPRVEYVEGLQQPVYTESTRILKLPMRAGSWRSFARDTIIRNDEKSSDAVDVPEPFQLQLARDVWLPVTSASCQVCGFCGTVVSRELAPLHLAWCDERAWAAIIGGHIDGMRDCMLSSIYPYTTIAHIPAMICTPSSLESDDEPWHNPEHPIHPN